MFNNSNQSSERSVRQTQRGASSQKSRSAHSSLSSRHSENKSWKLPEWVHCEKCFATCISKEDFVLLSCGHIFCCSCLRIENTILHNQSVSCLCCKSSAQYKLLNSSLELKLHGMFCQNWTDHVLSINLRNIRFMMTKSQGYLKFLSESIKQMRIFLFTDKTKRRYANNEEWIDRHNAVKLTLERIQKLKRFDSELITKMESMKGDGSKAYKNVQLLNSFYARKKKAESRSREQSRQSQSHQTKQTNYEKNLKFVSSGRNEHSNQYIGQLKTPQRPTNENQRPIDQHHSTINQNQRPTNQNQRPTNQNQSTANIRTLSQRMVSQSLQRPNTNSNQFRIDTTSVSTGNDSRPQSATFRPQSRESKADNYRFQQPPHGQKRLAPSYNHDEYTTPSKRAALYPVQRESNFDTSNTSSGGFSLDLNDSRYNAHTKSIQSTKYANRLESTRRIPKFK